MKVSVKFEDGTGRLAKASVPWGFVKVNVKFEDGTGRLAKASVPMG